MPGSPLQALRDRTHNKPLPRRARGRCSRRSASSRTRTSSSSTSTTWQHGHRALGRLHRRDAWRAGEHDHRPGAAVDARPRRHHHRPRVRARLARRHRRRLAAWRQARLGPAPGLRGHLGAAVLLGRAAADPRLLGLDERRCCRATSTTTTPCSPTWSPTFVASVLQHAVLPAADDPDHLDRRLDPDDAQQHDHHAGRGLRPDGSRQGSVQPQDHVRTTRRATRSCPTCPASRCRSAS